MAAGAAAGLIWPEVTGNLTVVSNIFLRLIRSIIAPVLVGVLVTAVAGAGGIRGFGRIGWKSVVYFEATTTVALVLGWATVAVLRPGESATIRAMPADSQPPGFGAVLEQSFPASIFDAMARGDVLQIVVFCLIFGAAVGATGRKGDPVLRFAETLTAIAF